MAQHQAAGATLAQQRHSLCAGALTSANNDDDDANTEYAESDVMLGAGSSNSANSGNSANSR